MGRLGTLKTKERGVGEMYSMGSGSSRRRLRDVKDSTSHWVSELSAEWELCLHSSSYWCVWATRGFS